MKIPTSISLSVLKSGYLDRPKSSYKKEKIGFDIIYKSIVVFQAHTILLSNILNLSGLPNESITNLKHECTDHITANKWNMDLQGGGGLEFNVVFSNASAI